MNKAEQREVQKATQVASAAPEYAAATLATIHRAATRKTQAEIEAVVASLGLSRFVKSVNGCMVAVGGAA